MTIERLGDIIKNQGALDRVNGVRPDMDIRRVSHAGTKLGTDALNRSNYACIKRDYGDQPWCVIDPPDGPLYVGGTGVDRWRYDNTPPWHAAFDRAALVFFDGEVHVNLSYEFDFDDYSGDDSIQSLRQFSWLLESLDNYPVVDDNDLSQLEYDEALESMESIAKYDLPHMIREQHPYGDDALSLDPYFEITVDMIVEACSELDIDWDRESASDGSTQAVFSSKDIKLIAEHLTPPWFQAACDGLEWKDLGYPQPIDPYFPPVEIYEPVLPLPDPKDAETARNWWKK